MLQRKIVNDTTKIASTATKIQCIEINRQVLSHFPLTTKLIYIHCKNSKNVKTSYLHTQLPYSPKSVLFTVYLICYLTVFVSQESGQGLAGSSAQDLTRMWSTFWRELEKEMATYASVIA